MMLLKRKQTNPPESDLQASEILELLINADSCLQNAASSAIDAKAFVLSAELHNARGRIIEQIFSLMHDRKEIVELMSLPAQALFKQFIDRSSRRRNDGEN